MPNIEHFWQDLMFEEGYFTYPNLYHNMVKMFPTNSHFVEVGVWKGRSAAFMAVEINNSGKIFVLIVWIHGGEVKQRTVIKPINMLRMGHYMRSF